MTKTTSLLHIFSALALLLSVNPISAQTPTNVRILVDDDYPPYTYVSNGELKGIYIDFLKHAANNLPAQYSISFVPLPWKRALVLIENGDEFAILPPYLHTQKRPFIAHYSEPIGVEEVVVFCHKNISLDQVTNTKQALINPLRLGINAGYLLLNDKYKKAVSQNRITLASNKSTAHNIEKLIKGRIDCYINDKTSTLVTLQQILGKYEAAFMERIKIMDVISSQSAHVGFSRDFKKDNFSNIDFINALNDAIKIEKEKATQD